MTLSHLVCEQSSHQASQVDGSFFFRNSASVSECQLSLPLGCQPRTWILAGRKALFEYIRVVLANEPVEHLLALYLDTDLSLLKMKSIGSGSLHGVEFRIADVLRDGVALEAAALILVHNHPSGITEPSKEDIITTRKIRDISSYVDMPLLDHLIVTETGIASVGNW